jgi:hypothetical protein
VATENYKIQQKVPESFFSYFHQSETSPSKLREILRYFYEGSFYGEPSTNL